MNLSVCICYYEDHKHYLDGAIESLPSGVELVMTYTEIDNSLNEPVFELIEIQENKEKENCVKLYKLTYPFKDFSFSMFKNYCKTGATRDWILFIDADERLHYIPDEWKILDYCEADMGGIICNVACQGPGNEAYPLGERYLIGQVRLFRNKSEFKFKNRVHEDILTTIKQNGYRIVNGNIDIKHIGYNVTDNRILLQKLLRNVELGCRDIAEQGMEAKYSLTRLRLALNDLHSTNYIKENYDDLDRNTEHHHRGS